MALGAQDLAERFGDFGFVFDDEDTQPAGQGGLLASLVEREWPAVLQRQDDVEGGTAARSVGEHDIAAVGANDARAQGKPDAGALSGGLGGEERIEDAPAVLLPERRVRCRRPRCGPASARSVAPGRNLDGPGAAACGQRLPCIDDQVGQHLVNLVGVGDDRGNVGGEVERHVDVGRSQLEGQQLHRHLDQVR